MAVFACGVTDIGSLLVPTVTSLILWYSVAPSQRVAILSSPTHLVAIYFSHDYLFMSAVVPTSASCHLIIARHGETPWNAQHRMQGFIDTPLNTDGVAQAQALGLALQQTALHSIYSSDLRRALDTAKAVAQHHSSVPLVQSEALRERCYGIFQGNTFAENEARWPELTTIWNTRDPHFAPPGGESLHVFCQRTLAFVQQAVARHAGHTILIVAHGGVLDAVYRHALGIDIRTPRDWPLSNGGINRFTAHADGGLELVTWADEQHLQHIATQDTAVA